jgi:hypothetical protein
MIGLLCFVLAVLALAFKSKLRLEAENAVLRHQLIILRRRLHGRVRLTNHIVAGPRQRTSLTPSLRDDGLIARLLAWISTAARLRYVRLIALTLGSGWYATGSRSIGLSTRRANTAGLSATLNMQGEAYGRGATLSRGGFALVLGKAGSRATVRTMRSRGV